MRVLYSLFFYLSLPLVLLYLLLRGRKDARWRKAWGERFGHGDLDIPPGRIVVHAASVGEVNAAAPLIRALLERGESLVVTAFTPTGAERARSLFGDQLRVRYAPLDLPGATRRFVRHLRPRLLIVMETEVWPNLYAAADRAGLPIMLVNARLSERSVRGYRRFASLFSGALQRVRIALAQSGRDRDRLAACGVPAGHIVVAGNLKFDLQLPGGLTESARELRSGWGAERPVLLAASTHLEDEGPVLNAFTALRETLPSALLILVPRHPERFDAAAAAASGTGLRTLRLSEGRPASMQTDCLVVDAMGQLLRYYACCDLAFVGGSFGATGGHNPLEAAALGKAVVTGPRMHSFEEITGQLEEAGALMRVANPEQLEQAVVTLLGNQERCAAMGSVGRTLVESGRGALARTLEEIDRVLV